MSHYERFARSRWHATCLVSIELHYMRLIAYISAHGFGHWAQTEPVLKQISRLRPDTEFVLRTSLPEQRLRAWSDLPFKLVSDPPVEVGFIQKDALRENASATIEAVHDFHADWDGKVEREAVLLKELKGDMVLSNITPLAFLSAKKAGLRSVGLASLDWHASYRKLLPSNDGALMQIAAAYEACDLLLELPLGMPKVAFPLRKSIDHIARTSADSKQAIRKKMGLDQQLKLALVLFGGTRFPDFSIELLGRIPEWNFILPDFYESKGGMPFNVHINSVDCDIADLMMASDVIVSKPGYGVIVEAWAAQKPLAYVPRSEFPEYPYLKQWLDEYAPALELDRERFVRGDWLEVLEALVCAERQYPFNTFAGDRQAAEIIASFLPEKGGMESIFNGLH